MPLATKDGALIVKDGSLTQDCNCCEKGMCCKSNNRCTTETASQCRVIGGTWTTPRYGVVCPPSGCCCTTASNSLTHFENCLEGGCLPDYIDITFNFPAPQRVINYYFSNQDGVRFWQHQPVTFSGSCTLARGGLPQFNIQGELMYFLNSDPSGARGYSDWMPEGFANAASISIVYYPGRGTMEFGITRRMIHLEDTLQEPCNAFAGPSNIYHAQWLSYGSCTSDTGHTGHAGEDTADSSVHIASDFYEPAIYYSATASGIQAQIKNCFCYGTGSNTGSYTEGSYIDYNILALPCEQRPFVLNGHVRADDSVINYAVTDTVTVQITDARKTQTI